MGFRPLSRRAALKGMGVSIALPFLEAMTPSVRAAEAAAGAVASAPRRMVFVYFPNGVNMDTYKPTGEGGEGGEFELSRTLSAFKPFKDNMTVIANLADANAKGGGAHACTMPAYLSGASIYKTQGNDLRAAMTCDPWCVRARMTSRSGSTSGLFGTSVQTATQRFAPPKPRGWARWRCHTSGDSGLRSGTGRCWVCSRGSRLLPLLR